MPFDETLEISVMWDMSPKYSVLITSFSELPYYQWLEERLNVRFKWTHTPQLTFAEQASLVIASGNYPDVIKFDDGMYRGGINKAYEDGILINLSPIMEKGYMPYLSLFYETFPEYVPQVQRAEGFLSFPFIRAHDAYLVFSGPMVRADLIDKYGLEIPETIDNWDNMLRTFKDNGVINPLTMEGLTFIKTTNTFTGAFGVSMDIFQENGRVIYGPADKRFKKFLELMQKWYNDGLLDPDFISINSDVVRAKLAEGVAGSAVGLGTGHFTAAWNAVIDQNPGAEYRLMGVPYPVENEGDIAPLGQRTSAYSGNGDAYITSGCKNPELVAMVMDFNYSEEANKAMFWGIEDINYTAAPDGKVQLWRTNGNSDIEPMTEGWSKVKSVSGYSRLEVPGPYIQGIIDYGAGVIYNNQEREVPQPEPRDPAERAKYRVAAANREAINIWSEPRSGLMPLLSFAPEDSTRRDEIMTAVNTYCDESIILFILGRKPLEEFDSFVDQIRRMGINEVIEITQRNLDEQWVKK